jgi:hypothetical protein
MAAGEDVVRRRERRGRHNAIDEVRVLAGGVLPPAAVLATRDFCRPVYEAGALVLHALPAGPGRVAPFEVPNPTPCCAAHP